MGGEPSHDSFPAAGTPTGGATQGPPPVVLHEAVWMAEAGVSPAARFAPSGASRRAAVPRTPCHEAPRTTPAPGLPTLCSSSGAWAAPCTPPAPVPVPSQALAAAPCWFSLPNSEPNTKSLIWNNSRLSAKGKNPALPLFPS